MILDKNLNQYVAFHEDSIAQALSTLIEARGRIICAIDAHNYLHGVCTIGDFLRWISITKNIDLTNPLSDILNTDYIYAEEGDKPDKIRTLLQQVAYVPILDESKRLIAVARRRDNKIRIADFTISSESPTFIIAEIGNNHNGSLDLAKRLIDSAVDAGANCAKFQMRQMETLYTNTGNPDDIRENLGAQYTLDLLARFQLSNDEMIEAFDYCKAREIIPLCTPWESESLAILEAYGMPAYKVASADMTNHPFLRDLASTGKPLICSTGMSVEDEIKETVDVLLQKGAQYVMLHCNSTYPAPFHDINLRYLERLREISDSHVGYSGHERGIHVPVAAVTLGAKIIEKHLTMDRNMEGNDHKVSLLPDEFKQMVEQIRQVEASLGKGEIRHISQGEMMNRVTLAKSLVITEDLAKGEYITGEIIDIKSPGRGLQPNRIYELIGRRARRDFQAGDFFYPSDLEADQIVRRTYEFTRVWGIPVRYFDYQALMIDTNPGLLEFHLSYKDMEVDFREFVQPIENVDLVVHSPELFAGDHIMDLASTDESYRSHSMMELQRVIDLTRELNSYFPAAKCPKIIVNAGGFTHNRFLEKPYRKSLYNRLAKSLSQLDADGVELIPQTMPPFPWHFGGQQYHNLFLDPEDTAEFCEKHGYRLCFDTSHSKLAANHLNLSFKEFIDIVGPYSAHLHIVDAAGVDSEGLQIGDGDIDFPAVAEILAQVAPAASFVPEIWQGHENNGEGFWIALERLEPYF